VGIAATIPAADGIDIVGAASCMIGADPETCEFAITIVDPYAGGGLGKGLLTTLIEVARRRGLRVMEGFVLAANKPMLELARRLGFEIRFDPDDLSVRIVRLELGSTGSEKGC
jgi:acetyltransferase